MRVYLDDDSASDSGEVVFGVRLGTGMIFRPEAC